MLKYTKLTTAQRKEYHRIKQVEYQERYPKRIEHRNRVQRYKKYGLTEYTFNELLKEQENKCKICEKTFGSIRNDEEFLKRIYIDHCHITKKVRGLLCPYCNSLLGYAKNSDIVLMKAIKYILETSYPKEDREVVRTLVKEYEDSYINTFYKRI